MRRKQKGRPVNGILVLDKPAGITSNAALQRVKYLFFAAKAGHTGSLDPLATGVLPVCFGEATKFTQFLLDADKRYQSTFCLGVSTETGDADGKIISEVDASQLTTADVEQVIAKFCGEIDQVPSMYSALKKDGQPLYKLARRGIEVERDSRRVTIFSYRLVGFRPGRRAEADVEIHCSKGTYVRTLAEDLGAALGVGGHVLQLRRNSVGPFSDEQSIGIEQLEALREGRRGEDLDFLLKPVDAAVAHLMSIELPQASAWHLLRGQPVMAPRAYRDAGEGDIVRIFDDGGEFIGVGEILEDGKLAPRRLVVDGRKAV